MAISFPVNFIGAQAAATPLTKAYASAVSAGDVLVAFIIALYDADTVNSVSDNLNGQWTKAFGPIINGIHMGISGYYCLNSAAGTPTVTADFATANHHSLCISRISGLSGGGVLDQYKAVASQSTNPTTGLSATLGAAVCGVVAGLFDSATPTGIGSGWTDDSHLDQWYPERFLHQVTASNTAIEANWLAPNGDFAAGLMVFRDLTAAVSHAATGSPAASAASLAGTASRTGSAATHPSSGALSAAAASLAGTASRTGSAATHPSAGALSAAAASLSGTANKGVSLLTDVLINNTGTPLASVAVSWTWLPAGRIGSLAAITPTDGTGTTQANGTLRILGLPAGAGVLLVARLNAGPSTDDVYYQAAVIA